MSKKDEHIDYTKAAKYLAGECSESEIAEFEQWVNASSENEGDFINFGKIWKSGSIEEFDRPKELKTFDADKAWQLVDKKISEEESLKLNPGGPNIWKYISGVAAVLIIGTGIWLYSVNKQTVTHNMIVLSAGDESETFYLPDSSKVTLNKKSSVSYNEDFALNERRTAELKSGEAFFDVVRNESKPFLVLTNNSSIEVLGTKFSVREDLAADETILKVTEGKVKFSVRDKEQEDFLIVTKNQSVTFEGRSTSFSQIQEIKNNDLFWVNRIFIFRKAKLKEVFEDISANYNVTVSYDSGVIANCELSARFEDESIEDIAAGVALSMNLEYTINGDSLVFTGQGCGHD